MGLLAPYFLCIASFSVFLLSLFTPLWITTFLWLVPLFLNSKHVKNSALVGFFWGFCFYLIHSLTLFLLIIQEGIIQFLWLPFIFIIYMSLWSSGWFYFLDKISFIKNFSFSSALQVFVTFGYFYSVDQFVLRLLGVWEGYPLVFPLIGCAEKIELLFMIPYIGKWGLLICIITMQYTIAALINIYYNNECYSKQKLYGLIFITSVSVAPFLSGFIFNPYKQHFVPFWLKDAVVITPKINYKNPYQAALDLCLKMEKAQKKWPNVCLFFTPETAFPFSLKDSSMFLNMWHENSLKEKGWLYLGCQSENLGNLLNTVFLIHRRRIIQTYVKSKLIPFFERKVALPATFQIYNDLFLKDKRPFTTAASFQDPLDIKHPLLDKYTVYICSEWFYTDKKEAPLYLVFTKLNRFKKTPWKALLDKLIMLYIKIKNKPTFIISEDPYFFYNDQKIKVKKIS